VERQYEEDVDEALPSYQPQYHPAHSGKGRMADIWSGGSGQQNYAPDHYFPSMYSSPRQGGWSIIAVISVWNLEAKTFALMFQTPTTSRVHQPLDRSFHFWYAREDSTPPWWVVGCASSRLCILCLVFYCL